MTNQEVSIWTDDFSVADEYEKLNNLSRNSGAAVFFVGKVRQDLVGEQPVIALELEHYPSMTVMVLQAIIAEAKQRFNIQCIRIIHRIGRIEAGEQIVFVGVTAAHRADAFQCGEFLMDYLKTKAPFWKKEITSEGGRWVQAKGTDETAASRW